MKQQTFPCVSFAFQSSFKSALQITIRQRRRKGGKVGEVTNLKQDVDVAVSPVLKQQICSRPQVIACKQASSGHSNPLCIISSFPPFIPCLYIYPSGVVDSEQNLIVNSCILIHHFTRQAGINLSEEINFVLIYQKMCSFFIFVSICIFASQFFF